MPEVLLEKAKLPFLLAWCLRRDEIGLKGNSILDQVIMVMQVITVACDDGSTGIITHTRHAASHAAAPSIKLGSSHGSRVGPIG